jgi:hypothetical protein
MPVAEVVPGAAQRTGLSLLQHNATSSMRTGLSGSETIV